jgi:hypothetical protein
MPDVAIPSAESSPASPSTPAAAAQTGDTPAPLKVPQDKAAYAEWRKTGKLPTDKPKEGSAPSSSSSDAPAGDGAGAESETASEAGTNKQERGAKPRGTAETRLNEILGDLKRAGLTPAELKSFKREAAAAAAAPPPAPSAPPAAAPAAQEPATPKLERTPKPKQEDFETFGQWEEARDAWQANETRVQIAEAIAEEHRKFADAETNRRNAAMLAEATERYGDDAKGVIEGAAKDLVGNKELPGVIVAMFNDTPVLGDLLYVMGSKPGEMSDFIALCKRSPGEAVRKLALIEHLVKEELANKKAGKPAAKAETGEGDGEAGTPARGEDGKFRTNVPPPAKRVTNAPAPPSETGGRQAAPPDEVEQAATTHDFRAYRKAANARDLAAKTGR